MIDSRTMITTKVACVLVFCAIMLGVTAYGLGSTLFNERVSNSEALTMAAFKRYSDPRIEFVSRPGESTYVGGCFDGVDNDTDGVLDCADADCGTVVLCKLIP